MRFGGLEVLTVRKKREWPSHCAEWWVLQILVKLHLRIGFKDRLENVRSISRRDYPRR